MGGPSAATWRTGIAGHTTRFRAIVSHAGLWALEQMFGTTDCPAEWRRQLGSPATQPERYADNSPDRHVSAITTPMLVIHGDKDYRVPVGEALRLWTDLAGRPGHLAGSKFLYSPTRTTGSSAPATRGPGMRPCSRSSASTCSVSLAPPRSAVRGAAVTGSRWPGRP